MLLAASPPMHRLVMDKAYDSNDVRAFLAAQGTEAVIAPFDRTAYRDRNIIERACCRLKDWRGIATRTGRRQRPKGGTRPPATSWPASASPSPSSIRLRTYCLSQKVTVAASVMALKKVWAQRS